MKKAVSLVLALILALSLASCGAGGNSANTAAPGKPGDRASAFISDVIMQGNGLSDFDLKFLALESGEENKVYSPLSIKYALQMLAEGAAGDTRAQLDGVIGKYSARKYVNSANLSFANALFVRDSFKDSLKSAYAERLKSAYDAELITDSFKTPDALNGWVKDKTLGLIPSIMDDLSALDYVLVNALAVDMEWNRQIQSETGSYSAQMKNECFATGDPDRPLSYGVWVSPLMGSGYHRLQFKGAEAPVSSVKIAAAANKYDIISALGEENIRRTVLEEYTKYKALGGWEYEPFRIEKYMADLKDNYGKVSSSTDFMFYDDEHVKAFAKDLKTYDGVTLQYVGIMPKELGLQQFIEASDAASLDRIVSGLKPIEAGSFEDGILTVIEGYIPMFSFEYELKLMEDLKAIGIKDVFDADKADLSGLSSVKTYIGAAVHKATIDFSNDGIKASAATALGGQGAAGPGFEYWFEVPVKRIDLTFDRPFLYLIRDKATGEVWFTGTVYQPEKYQEPRW